ncbi:MAG: hypothetical protein C5B48_08970 [Candidatus Rokuibacteriota bacterium]|nr:MAG: hypothetical protein C5B48_08970 [Candidatus Rokubacteria bacterium]
MRKVLLLVICLAAAAVVPAQAKAPKPDHPAKNHPAKSHKCQPHKSGYNARGTLVTATLNQTAGAATPKRGDDRYSGSVTVDVSKANHHGATGSQTYTLDNVRVRFYASDHSTKPGDRVKIKGKITLLPKKCDATGFTPTITVRKVELKPPKK